VRDGELAVAQAIAFEEHHLQVFAHALHRANEFAVSAPSQHWEQIGNARVVLIAPF
jgi:uncharacterized protein with PIN domain